MLRKYYSGKWTVRGTENQLFGSTSSVVNSYIRSIWRQVNSGVSQEWVLRPILLSSSVVTWTLRQWASSSSCWKCKFAGEIYHQYTSATSWPAYIWLRFPSRRYSVCSGYKGIKTSAGKRLRLFECPPPSSTTVKKKNKEKQTTRS